MCHSQKKVLSHLANVQGEPYLMQQLPYLMPK